MISGAARFATEKAVFRPALPMSFSPGISEMHMRQIEPNVWEFLESAAARYGRIHAEKFAGRMHTQMIERGIESPIEDMFFIAVNLQCAARYKDVNPDPDEYVGNTPIFPDGVFLTPQVQVDKYRVDFLLQRTTGKDPGVVIELDGHAFHDKDKKQRSYEKARDRALVKAGYRVLHYTGSDVAADPYRVAFEALEVLGALTDGEAYDPTNPLGTD